MRWWGMPRRSPGMICAMAHAEALDMIQRHAACILSECPLPYLVRADVQAAVDLHRVRADDLPH